MDHPARYFDTLENAEVKCTLCPAECHIRPGKRGVCRSRKNVGGRLVTDNYGELVTLAVDPIEKKPLYHFRPTTQILSTGANCCNLNCRHCQNWTISQQTVPTSYASPEQLVALSREYGSDAVAFTYTEPMVWFEYLMDVAPVLKQAGVAVVLVSNGYINEKPLAELLPLVDAANVDIKGIRPTFYKNVCGGKIEPILENIRTFAESDVHIELTNLIIPRENDADRDVSDLIDFVADLPGSVPLHFSAYHADYKMTNPATPAQTLRSAFERAKEVLDYVFVGNMFIADASDSFCPHCGHLLISRSGFRAQILGLDEDRCASCGQRTYIIPP